MIDMIEIISMTDAKAQGKTRYFTGKPCPYGHISERIASTRACAECTRERKHQWNRDNPEKVAEQTRNYVARNPEKVKRIKSESQKRNRKSANRRNQKYAEANREKLREKNALWAKENPEKVCAKTARYRAQKLQATPIWADFPRIERAYELCQECRAKGIDAQVDHIIPLQGDNVCGLHVQGNLQIIHAQHNRSKSNIF